MITSIPVISVTIRQPMLVTWHLIKERSMKEFTILAPSVVINHQGKIGLTNTISTSMETMTKPGQFWNSKVKVANFPQEASYLYCRSYVMYYVICNVYRTIFVFLYFNVILT